MNTVSLIDITNDPGLAQNLGISSIASFLRKNEIGVALYHLSTVNQDEDTLCGQISLDSSIYGFSLFNTTILTVFALAKKIKDQKPDAIVFVGGRLATEVPEKILTDCEFIDYVVLGFGENPVLNLVEAWEKNEDLSRVDSIVSRNKTKAEVSTGYDITGLPWVARDGFTGNGDHLTMAAMMTSIGCTHNCSFCSHNSYSRHAKTKRWIGREIEDVFNEIKFLYQEYKICRFRFNDGCMTDPGHQGKERIKKLCDLVLSYPDRFSFYGFIRANSFTDEDLPLIRLLKKAGFCTLFVGIEAANSQDLELYDKNVSVTQNEKIMSLLSECDIETEIGFIMLNPLSTKETLKMNFDFLVRHKIYHVLPYIMKLDVYYNTNIHFKLAERGLLRPDFSYLNPGAYTFIDPYAEEVNKFIGWLTNRSVQARNALAFRGFVPLLDSICACEPEFAGEIALNIDNIQRIKGMYARELAAFFRWIYVDCDIKGAKKNFLQFEDNMANINNSFFQEKDIIMEKFRKQHNY